MSIMNNKRFYSLLLLVVSTIIVASALLWILNTPPLYQSQIIVVETNPCNHEVPFISCPGPATLVVRLASIEEIRNATLRELSLPDDTFYEVAATSYTQGITVTIEAESPASAQSIANEMLRQMNVFAEKTRLDSYNYEIQRLSEEVAALENTYPAPNQHLTQRLNPLREELNDVKLNKESLMAGRSGVFDVLQPATYPETAFPYWKHVLLQYLYPAKLNR